MRRTWAWKVPALAQFRVDALAEVFLGEASLKSERMEAYGTINIMFPKLYFLLQSTVVKAVLYCYPVGQHTHTHTHTHTYPCCKKVL